MNRLLLPIALFSLIFSSLHSQVKWRQFTSQDGLSSDVVLSIYESSIGDIWIGTDMGTDYFSGVSENFISTGANCFFESSTGHLFALTSSGIYLFDGQKWDEPEIFDDISSYTTPESVIKLGGKIWFATESGLVGFNGQKWQLYDPDVSIKWLVKTADGLLWSKNWKLGLISFDGQKWKAEFNIDNSLIDNVTIQTALVTSTGKILLGTSLGLFEYDPSLNSVARLELGKIGITTLHQTAAGNIWVISDVGIFEYQTGQWIQHLQKGNLGDGVNTIVEELDGDILIGGENGLFHYDGIRWLQLLSFPTNCITVLRDGIIMVGSSSGLFILSQEESNQHQLALNGKAVLGIHQAPDGNMWFQSSQGISSFDGIRWVHFTEQIHGDPLGEIIPASNGQIWFSRQRHLYV